MTRGRALLVATAVLSGSVPYVEAKNNPPDVIYPTTDDQSLEQMMKNSPSDRDITGAPAMAAPVAVEEKPHPQPLSQRERGAKQDSPNPLPSGEGPAKGSMAGGEAPSSVPPTYKVWIWQENGDTLWRIAQKVYGDKDKWPLIYAANRDVLKDPNKIYPKQVLKIPPADWQP